MPQSAMATSTPSAKECVNGHPPFHTPFAPSSKFFLCKQIPLSFSLSPISTHCAFPIIYTSLLGRNPDREGEAKKKETIHMGNRVSCNLKSSANLAKYKDPAGNIRRLDLPAKAAELMLESPGFVVSPAQEVLQTLRVAAMPAEEELKAGELYLMFPAARACCWVAEAELETIAQSSERMSRRSTKVFPVPAKKEIKIEGKTDTGFPGHTMRSYRNWTPALETITEGMWENEHAEG